MESDLIALARSGDRAAFEALIGPLIEPACQLARSMLGDWGEAEDAVQEAALSAWRSIGRLRDGTVTIRPWFLTVVANRCRSRRRSGWQRLVGPLQEHRLAERDPIDALAQHADLRSEIRRLQGEERALLALHYYLDLPLDEVGRVLGISEAAAKSRLYRTLRRLRPRLQASEARP